MSCTSDQKKNGPHDSKALDYTYGEKLIENDFLAYADPVKLDSLKIGISKSFNIYDEATNKFAPIDAEELTEFNFDFFVPQLNRILSKRAFNLEIELTNDYKVSNEVIINGQKIELYSNAELESGIFWDSGARNFFKKVNDLLKIGNIKERFYMLYGGNDLHTFLLTNNQFKIISDRYASEKNEIPYLP